MRNLDAIAVLAITSAIGVAIFFDIEDTIKRTDSYSDKLYQCILDNKDQLNAKDWCAAKIRLSK